MDYLLYLSKVLEYISFIAVDVKCMSNGLETAVRTTNSGTNAIEFCSIYIEKLLNKKSLIVGAFICQSSKSKIHIIL